VGAATKGRRSRRASEPDSLRQRGTPSRMTSFETSAEPLPDARGVIIYGIRDKATGEIRYVGQTTSLSRRRSVGYAGKVARCLAKIEWEYVELARATIDTSAAEEQRHIDMLRAAGVRLLNTCKAARSRARPQAPKPRLGPWQERQTKLPRRLFTATAEEFAKQQSKAERAGISWNAWARRALAVAE
jgi:hypothetical protein